MNPNDSYGVDSASVGQKATPSRQTTRLPEEYIFFCAREKGLKRVYLAQVGGGAFASLLGGNFNYPFLRTVTYYLQGHES